VKFKLKELFWISLFCLTVYPLLSSADEKDNSINFGIVPQQSAKKLASKWQPVFDVIQERTGLRILFKTASNIPTFEKRVANGSFDAVYMNPYHFTVYNENPGYQALVKAKEKWIKGIVVVAKDSPITQLTQLQNKIMAFPAPAAFAASVLPRAFLKQENISITPKYVQTHDSVYLNVARGIYPAGGGVKRTFSSMPEGLKQQLRILWTTPGYTPHAIAVHPTLGKQKRKRLLEGLLKLADTQQGLSALDGLKIKGFEPAQNSDWDDVRDLNIDLID